MLLTLTHHYTLYLNQEKKETHYLFKVHDCRCDIFMSVVMCGLPVCTQKGSLVLVLGFSAQYQAFSPVPGQLSMKYKRKSNVMEMAA